MSRPSWVVGNLTAVPAANIKGADGDDVVSVATTPAGFAGAASSCCGSWPTCRPELHRHCARLTGFPITGSTRTSGALPARGRRHQNLCVAFGPERDVSCGKCGRVHRSEVWGRLELVAFIDHSHLCEIVSAWPAEVAIEIRRCDGCGGSIARKCRAESP